MASKPATLPSNFNTLIECLIRHFVWSRKNEVLPQIFSYSPSFVVPFYRDPVADAVCLLLSVIEEGVEKLFKIIEPHIKHKKNLEAIMLHLGKYFCGGSPKHLLFFIAVTVRIFTKIRKPVHYTMREYIETVSWVLHERKTEILEIGGFTVMNDFASEVLKNPKLLEDYRIVN